MSHSFILVLKCPDTRGIVAAVATFLAEHDASIVDSHQFHDASGNLFYMRTAFVGEDLKGATPHDADALRGEFEPIASHFDMEWEIIDTAHKPRVLIGVSKIGHCLYDLLHRWRSGLLDVEVAGIFSNHEDMRSFADWSGVPYFHLPISKETKAAQRRKS